MKPLLVVNPDKVTFEGLEHLEGIGYDYVFAEGEDAPAVQSVPAKEDRRFTAAVAAMQGLAGSIPASLLVGTAIRVADTLLAGLSKDG